MPSFEKTAKVLKEVLEESGMSPTEVSAVSGIPLSNLSHHLAGRRRMGPKILADLLRAFSGREQRRRLVVAYLDDDLVEVNGYISSESDHWSVAKLLGDAAKPKHPVPVWLEELVEEAIQAGESKPEVLALIRELFEVTLRFKKAKKSSR